MSGEDDVAVESAHTRRQHLEKRIVVVPALDEDELCSALERRLQPLAIAGDREAGVMRREHEPDERLGSTRERSLHGLANPRPPVLHADEDRYPELAFKPGTLRFGDHVERRAAADPAIAFRQLVDRLL